MTKCLRQEWPDVKIVFRGDGGFCRWKMMRWCDNHGVYCIIGLGKNKRLTEQGQDAVDAAETPYVLTEQKQRIFTEMQYSAKNLESQSACNPKK